MTVTEAGDGPEPDVCEETLILKSEELYPTSFIKNFQITVKLI